MLWKKNSLQSKVAAPNQAAAGELEAPRFAHGLTKLELQKTGVINPNMEGFLKS